jgi:glutamate racemase
MATPATLKGKRFLDNKAKFDAVCSITPLPAPGLMELVEAGKSDTPETDAFLLELLKPYLGQLDALVLGCTHYPFVENALRRVAGENITLFDGAVVTARQTKVALEEADLLHDGCGEVIFQNSLPGEKMLTLSRQLAGME